MTHGQCVRHMSYTKSARYLTAYRRAMAHGGTTAKQLGMGSVAHHDTTACRLSDSQTHRTQRQGRI